MLWFKKQRHEQPAPERDLIVPAELPVALDEGLFLHHLAALQTGVERDGGVEAYLDSLNAKQRLFVDLLRSRGCGALALADVEQLLDRVFTARRRIYPLLAAAGEAWIRGALEELLEGAPAVRQRMEAFASGLVVAAGGAAGDAKSAAKGRRAAFDFAAEVLHFVDPVRYPLMSRWVWDQGTGSGALREFIRGSDAMTHVPLGADPEVFEGAREWLKARITEQGIFRDVHFWIDLVLGQAYVAYLRSVAEGNLGGDFGRGARPEDQLRKLLGIDPRPEGRTRVKKVLSRD
ncbi:MAG: hypothetical protein DI596_04050 [Azospira oryzae]|uniref:Uncharacterized protein n=1 Tax=Pelomicrobium methylotrophicum TaxID=2602750 RepID=A0A5C7EYG6_9PROT|nr:hypothetical protein [Pelomicrobium methylotrophicum]PZP62174.1 MAG: hypothetical protein DI596_04050 [Azospira oryzae]PZP81506.1 MAG: hypothetical protein DI593_04050 [Azospira oryzae]TXF12111.1 hypothetical protein FR698_07645 [Pelomicrobium methylotrophicum]